MWESLERQCSCLDVGVLVPSSGVATLRGRVQVASRGVCAHFEGERAPCASSCLNFSVMLFHTGTKRKPVEKKAH